MNYFFNLKLSLQKLYNLLLCLNPVDRHSLKKITGCYIHFRKVTSVAHEKVECFVFQQSFFFVHIFKLTPCMNTVHHNGNNSYLKIWSLPIFGTLQHICANTVQRAHIPTSSTTKRGVAEGTLHDSTFFKKISPC